MRIMINGEGDSALWMSQNVKAYDMVAAYRTGSQGVPWSDSDLALFPDVPILTIDQGGTGSPLESANIRDVENGAWTVQTAVHDPSWNVARPTIYCDRSTLPALSQMGWTGDVWLADPSFTGTTVPDLSPMNCVAVQNQFFPLYESSLVFDDSWPTPPRKEIDMLNAEIMPNDVWAVPFHPGAFTSLALYVPSSTADNPSGIGITMHSVSKGDTYHNEAIHQSSPHVITMPEPDIDAIWLHNQSGTQTLFASIY